MPLPFIGAVLLATAAGALLGGAIYWFLTLTDEDVQAAADFLRKKKKKKLLGAYIWFVKKRKSVRRFFGIERKRKSGVTIVREEKIKLADLPDDVRADIEDGVTIDVTEELEYELF